MHHFSFILMGRTLRWLSEQTGIPYAVICGLNTGRVGWSTGYAERVQSALGMRHPATAIYPELADTLELSDATPPPGTPSGLSVAQATALAPRLGLHPAVLLWPELRAALDDGVPVEPVRA